MPRRSGSRVRSERHMKGKHKVIRKKKSDCLVVHQKDHPDNLFNLLNKISEEIKSA